MGAMPGPVRAETWCPFVLPSQLSACLAQTGKNVFTSIASPLYHKRTQKALELLLIPNRNVYNTDKLENITFSPLRPSPWENILIKSHVGVSHIKYCHILDVCVPEWSWSSSLDAPASYLATSLLLPWVVCYPRCWLVIWCGPKNLVWWSAICLSHSLL